MERRGGSLPPPKNQTPFLALLASGFGPFVPLPVKEKVSPPQNKFGLTLLVNWVQCSLLGTTEV